MRGRLIHPFLAVIAPIDTKATEEWPVLRHFNSGSVGDDSGYFGTPDQWCLLSTDVVEVGQWVSFVGSGPPSANDGPWEVYARWGPLNDWYLIRRPDGRRVVLTPGEMWRSFFGGGVVYAANPELQATGFDHDFDEPVRVPDGSARGSHSARKEHDPVTVSCQIEIGSLNVMQQMKGGDVPSGQLSLVFHFMDLERRGWIDPVTGEATIHLGDRLVSLLEPDGALIQSFADPPGMYATKVEPVSWGLSSRKRNLLHVTFSVREQSTRAI